MVLLILLTVCGSLKVGDVFQKFSYILKKVGYCVLVIDQCLGLSLCICLSVHCHSVCDTFFFYVTTIR